jgi:polysaccharide export outer membrane protein
MLWRVVFACLLTCALAGCNFLPASGPSTRVIEHPRSDTPSDAYDLVDFDAEVASIVDRSSGLLLSTTFGDRPPAPEQRLGVGDVIQITVFEAGPGGLFTPTTEGISLTGGRQTTIPPLTVDRDGRISVPYAGLIEVDGRTPKQVAESIRRAFGPRALEPQVVVSLVNNAAMTASVLGEITTGGKINLGIRGERVLDVIAAAGGIKAPEHETFIRLIRGQQTSTVSLRTIIRRPSENIFVHPRDTLLVIRERHTFTALGAVSTQGVHNLTTADMSITQALGLAGGLVDTRADASGLFLFRFENAQMMRALAAAGKLPQRKYYAFDDALMYPVIYRIWLSRPETMFALSRTRINHGDVLYVANSRSVEFDRFVSLVTKVYSLARGPVSIASVSN